MKKTRIQSILAGLFRPLFPALAVTCACGLFGTLSGNREIRLSQFACLYLLSIVFCFLLSRKQHALLFACGILGLVFAAFRLRELLGGEACLFVSRYLEYLNPYYHKSFGLLEPWNTLASKVSGTEGLTLYLATGCLWTGCAPFARKGRIGVCGFWLFAAAAAGMAVGITPEGAYLPLGLAAVLSWYLIRRSGSVRSAALILSVSGALALAAAPFADRISTERMKVSIREAEEALVSSVHFPGVGGTMTAGIGCGDLGNAGVLVQDDSDALLVQMNEKPEESVYLAAYTGSSYEDNCWEAIPEEDFVSETGLSSEEVWSRYTENWLGDGSVQMTVEIYDAAARFLYHPYAAALPGNGENAAGDAYIGRRGSTGDTFAVPLLLLSGSLEDWQSLSDSLEDTGDIYRDFAEKYNGDLQDGEWGTLKNRLLRKLPEGARSDVEKARWVREFLEETAEYSLAPGTAPAGENAVIWFLTEKQEGFCMHFASAGTVLLRMWGVTARYAEGYLLKPSDFRQTEDGKWEALVKNRSAHAWTEIFLPGLGWVPVEMTPGFGEESGGASETVDARAEMTAEAGVETSEEDATERTSVSGTTDSESRRSENDGTRANEPSAESGISGKETESGTETAPSEADPDTFSLVGALLTLGILLVLSAAVIHAMRPRSETVRHPRRSLDPQTEVLRLGREILSCCIRRGMPASLTFASPGFLQAAAEFLMEEELTRLAETKEIVNRAEFGYNQLQDEDYRKVWECFRLISKRRAG